jgi:hypothetical protein
MKADFKSPLGDLGVKQTECKVINMVDINNYFFKHETVINCF